jgi:hypothetical protein
VIGVAASSVPQLPVDLGQTSFLGGEAGPGGLFDVIGNGYPGTGLQVPTGSRSALS